MRPIMIGNAGHLLMISFPPYCLDMRDLLRPPFMFFGVVLCGFSMWASTSVAAPTSQAAAEPAAPLPAAPIPVKVVVVTMFQIGKLTGDKPGEAHLWVERDRLDRALPFPLGEYELRMNDAGLLLICTGGGVTNSSSSIMALGLDARFDLSKAYWLVAGIAGGDPLDVSLGTAAWAKHVVDGDLLYEIDAREIPADWPYGLLPLGAKKPNDIASGWTVDTIHYPLNAALADWAYALTKDHPVADSPGIARFRRQFAGYPAAVRPPFVTIGDSLSAAGTGTANA
jgi:purine nucleoside permease